MAFSDFRCEPVSGMRKADVALAQHEKATGYNGVALHLQEGRGTCLINKINIALGRFPAQFVLLVVEAEFDAATKTQHPVSMTTRITTTSAFSSHAAFGKQEF